MRRWTTAVLLGALLLGGCTSGQGDPASVLPDTSTSPEESARPEGKRLDAIRRAAAQAVEVVLSYDHRTLDTDQEAATILMTPDYAQEFRASFAKVRDTAEEVAATSRAVALDSGVVSATADTVRILVFVDRTTRSGEAEGTVTRIAPVVSMRRWGSDWRVSDIATGTTAGPGDPTALEVSAARHATRTARAYLTLSWETIEQDLEAVQELIGGALAAQYAASADELVGAVRAHRTLQQPRVLAVGLSHVGPRRAEALVSALVTTTHQASGSEPTQEGRRLRLQLVREDDGWRATQLALVD